MSFFNSVGPTTWIQEGETQYWQYGWGDNNDHGLNIAGPNVSFNGSFDAELIAFDQGKQLSQNSGSYVYYVSIKNLGVGTCLYNLQVGGF